MATVRNAVTDGAKLRAAFAQSLRGTEFEGRLPEPNSSNIREFGEVLFTYQPLMNRFISYLVNKIAFTKVSKMYYTSPFGFAKRGLIPFGETIESIWVDVAKAHAFCKDTDDWAMLKQEKPDVVAAYINRNREDFYKRTVNRAMLQSAFNSEEAFGRLVDAIINGMYTGNEVDEMLYVMSLFSNGLDAGNINLVHVDNPTNEATAKSLLTAIRSVSNQLTIPSTNRNRAGVLNTTAKSDQRLFITPKAEAVTSVEALAYAFNVDRAEFVGRVTMIPEIPGHPEVVAILADEDWVNIYDNLFEAHDFFNGEKLYYNYWLHVWQTYFLSPFHNAVAFTTAAVTDYTAVVVAPTSATYTKGTVNAPNKIVVTTTPAGGNYMLDIKGNTAASTRLTSYVDADNNIVYNLEVGPEETGTIELTAKIVGNTDVTGSAKVAPAEA